MPDGSWDPLDRLLELTSIPPAPFPPKPEPSVGTPPDIARLLPIQRCPETGQALRQADGGGLRG